MTRSAAASPRTIASWRPVVPTDGARSSRRGRGRRRAPSRGRSTWRCCRRVARTPRAAHRGERHIERRRGPGHVRRTGRSAASCSSSTGPLGAILAVVAIYAVGVVAIARLHVPAVGRRPRPTARAGSDSSRPVSELPGGAGSAARVIGFGLQTFVRGLLTVLIVVAAIELPRHGRRRRRRAQRGDGSRRARRRRGAIGSLAGRERLAPAFAVALAAGAPRSPSSAWSSTRSSPCGAWSPSASATRSSTSPGSRSPSGPRRTTAASPCSASSTAWPTAARHRRDRRAAPHRGVGIQGRLSSPVRILPVAASAWPRARADDEGGLVRPPTRRAAPPPAALRAALAGHRRAPGRDLEPVAFDDGEWLMREGEPATTTSSSTRGGRGHPGRRRPPGHRPGSGVGEIALIKDVPRTASVRAVGPVTAFSLDRDAFLEAVTGHAASRVWPRRRRRAPRRGRRGRRAAA